MTTPAKNVTQSQTKNRVRLLPADVRKIKKNFAALDDSFMNDSLAELINPSNLNAIDVYEPTYLRFLDSLLNLGLKLRFIHTIRKLLTQRKSRKRKRKDPILLPIQT